MLMLKRNDKVISIGAATNSAIVHGHQVETGPVSLFIYVTSMNSSNTHTLFENGVIPKVYLPMPMPMS